MGRKDGDAAEAAGVTLGMLAASPVAALGLMPKQTFQFVAGAIAGATSKTAVAPLDRVKILLQVQGVEALREGRRPTGGVVSAVQGVWKSGGLKAFWKGNVPQLLRVVPYAALQLVSYDFYRENFRSRETGELSVVGQLAAGAMSGMTATTLTFPLDVLRLRMVVNDPSIAGKSVISVTRGILATEGPRAFTRGLAPALIGIGPFMAINFALYEVFKKAIPEDSPNWMRLGAGFASSLIGSLICYPMDTVRRQIQLAESPVKDMASGLHGIWARDGITGLYAGFIPNAMKSAPSNAVKLWTFDSLKLAKVAGDAELAELRDQLGLTLPLADGSGDRARPPN